MLFGWIWVALVIGAIIALVVWGIRRLTERDRYSPIATAGADPLSIAKERYARGEITKDQFDQIKKDLS